MQFDHKSLNETKQIKAGICDFEIIDCTEMVSKAGNPMAKIVLELTDSSNNKVTVNDYILSSFVWKIKKLLESIGMQNMFETDNLNSDDLIMSRGKCVMGYEEIDNGVQKRSFPKVKEYISKDKVSAENNELATQQMQDVEPPAYFNDDIPF